MRSRSAGCTNMHCDSPDEENKPFGAAVQAIRVSSSFLEPRHMRVYGGSGNEVRRPAFGRPVGVGREQGTTDASNARTTV